MWFKDEKSVIDLEIHFPCVWIHRNSLHLPLTASFTSKNQFKIKRCVGIHTSVSSHPLFDVSTYSHVYSLNRTKCKLYLERSICNKCTLQHQGFSEFDFAVTLTVNTWMILAPYVWQRFLKGGDVVLHWRDSESREQAGTYVNSSQQGSKNQHPLENPERSKRKRR